MIRPLPFALAGGIIGGLWMFLFTYIALGGYIREWMEHLQNFYPGYTVSVPGSFIGLGWAFVYWFVGFYLFAWLYNWLGGCCCDTKNK